MASKRIPKLCTHKFSGRAYATDPRTRKPVYFGDAGSAAALAAYSRWVSKYLLEIGRTPLDLPEPGESISVARLLALYMDHARDYYVKHGRPTSEPCTILQVLRVVEELFGLEDAAEFGARELKAVRANLVLRGQPRQYINKQISRVRRAWRWAVEEELLPGTVLHGLTAVRDLEKGRTPAREEEDVSPVSAEDVAALLMVAPATLCRLIRLQLLTSCRPQDVVRMRGEDIDRSETPWVYRPPTFKTEHLDGERVILLGPAAREILDYALGKRPTGWLFPSRGRGRNSRVQGSHLTVNGYRQAVTRACKQHGLNHFFPLQLRHSGLTEVRKRYGLETASAVGGHASINTTEIYAQKNLDLARKVAEEMG